MTDRARFPQSHEYYGEYAQSYDETAIGVPGDIEFYRGLAVEADGPVVELGVGTGRIAIPTALAGVPVLGLDLSPQMLAIAARKAREARVEALLGLGLADMRRFALARPADLVTIPFRAFSHNLTTQDQLSTLACCRAALRPGGRLALNVFNPNLTMIAEWMQRGGGGPPDSDERREYDPSEQRVNTWLQLPARGGVKRRVALRLRWVYRFEMEHLLGRNGFEVEALYGDFDGSAFDITSTELVWVARAV